MDLEISSIDSLSNGVASLLPDPPPSLDTNAQPLSPHNGDGILQLPPVNAPDPSLPFGSEPLKASFQGNASGWIAADSAPVSLPAPESQQSWATSKRHTFFLARVPRSVDENLRNDIKLAQSKLDQAIQKRDIYKVAIQEKKAQRAELVDKLRNVREKERVCREAFYGKRTELEPILIALGKFKNVQGNVRGGKRNDLCSSEGELNERIAELDYKIQHESLSLKEEKQLMREIKQLESTRGQVCANSILQQELTECLGPKEEFQDQYKFLSQDLDDINKETDILRAESEDIEKELFKLNKEKDALHELHDKANVVQSDAFAAVKELKKQESKKNDIFFQNLRDIQTAKNIAVQRKWEEVRDFCTNNLETFMDMWNSDEKFRAAYIKSNERSTIRRLETLDGRSLGPGEKSPQINDVNRGDAQAKASQMPNVTAVQASKIDGSSLEKVKKISPESKKENTEVFSVKDNQASKISSTITSAQVSEADSLPPKKDLPGKKSSHEVTKELSDGKENRNLKQNEVIDEPFDSEARALEIKERLKQEQIAKAKEAEERKKRRAEKSELKAQARAKKEAERKEKEKDRKAQKKAAAVANVEVADDLEPRDEGTVEKATVSDLEDSSKKDAVNDTINTTNRGQKGSGVARRKIASKQLRVSKAPLPSRLSKKSAFPIPLWASVVVIAVILLAAAIFFFLRL